MLASVNGLYGMIAALLLAAPAAVWLGLRLYAVIAAAAGCRKCRRLSESERTERCPLSAVVLAEIEDAGKNVRRVLIGLLIVLVAWWLLGTASDQNIALSGISLGAIVCCVMILIKAVTRLIIGMALPRTFRCRSSVIEAMRKNGAGFGWLLAAYLVVHILLNV